MPRRQGGQGRRQQRSQGREAPPSPSWWQEQGIDPENQRFGGPGGDTSFIAWLLSQGYRPTATKDRWIGPGQDIGRTDGGLGVLYKKLLNKEGGSWQADIMAQQLMQQYGLQPNQGNPFGLPYDPNLINAESKMAALQLMINEIERNEFLGNRDRAINELRTSLDSPTYQAMRDAALRRLENPDVYTEQDYERSAVGAQEANARALRDNLMAIQQNFAARGLGGSGAQMGLESRTANEAGRNILENRRAVDEMRARNRAEGLNTGFSQAAQSQSFLDNVLSQVAQLYGGIPERESELGGLAASLNTNYGGFRSGQGNIRR